MAHITTVCQKGRGFSMLLAMNDENLVLRPNCLLTRYPLVFITGFRSLFYYKRLCPELQDFLIAHGYRVLSPAMPFRNVTHRQRDLLDWLRSQPEAQFHFVLTEETAAELASVIKEFPASTSTLIPGKFRYLFQNHSQRIPLRYQIHSAYCRLQSLPTAPYLELNPEASEEFFQRFLDHCIELAENDHI